MEIKITTRTPKEIFPNAQGIIEYAFTLGVKDYFQFSDLNAVPCERGFQALSYYNEMEMRCTRQFLKAHQDARKIVNKDLKELCTINQGKLNLFAMVEKIKEQEKLDMIMDERLEFLHEPEIFAKLLSVVFFDENENPHRYDYSYAAKKAEIFLKAQTESNNLDFFLSAPIVKYQPYIASLSSDFPEYCRTVIAITTEHLKSIFTMLSEGNKNQEYYKSLLLRKIEALV